MDMSWLTKDRDCPCWLGTEGAHRHLSRPPQPNPSLLLASLYWGEQTSVLKGLVAALQPGDDLLLACTPGDFSAAIDAVGSERTIGCHALPEESAFSMNQKSVFLSFSGGGKKAAEEMLTTHEKSRLSLRHTLWARDVGFLQGGDTAYSLEGCRWNLAGPEMEPLFPLLPPDLLPPFGGGEVVFSPSGKRALSISLGTHKDAARAVALRASFPELSTIAFLPRHPDYMPHVDMIACWVSEEVLAVHEDNAAALNVALAPLLHDGVRLQLLPHDPPPGWQTRMPPTPHSRLGVIGGSDVHGFRGDPAGNYVQAIVTRNAVYVPQYGGVHAGADAAALASYVEAVAGDKRTVVGVPWNTKLEGGGGLHCLTTQLEGVPAARLLGALRDRFKEMQPVSVITSDGKCH